MKLVAGLGNPGPQYRGTRHNVGFAVIDLLASRHGADAWSLTRFDALAARWRCPAAGEDVWLLKPQTFMNLSGQAIGGFARYYDIALNDLLIVCDDVNLPLGRLRARGSGTEGGHNGLKSVAAHLGSIDYPRLRIGVGRGETRRDLADHVLARFEPDEMSGMESAVARAADAVDAWLDDGLPAMMNAFNRAEE